MEKAARVPRSPRGKPHRRRSHVGRLAAAAIGVASATGIGFGLNHAPQPSAVSQADALPDPSLTPGATDSRMHGTEVCTKDWKAGADGGPPVHGGSQTYSQAARHTSEAVKNEAFSEYGLQNPHDGGKSYEIDHLIPLSLGGRDVIANLWPQSRTASGYNAWVKDRLEFRLYNLLCHRQTGDPQITLAQAQEALRTDWTRAYQLYCANEDDCQPYREKNE